VIIEVREERLRPGAWWVVSIGDDGKVKPVRGPLTESGALKLADLIISSFNSSDSDSDSDPERVPTAESAPEVEHTSWWQRPMSTKAAVWVIFAGGMVGVLLGMLAD